MSNMLLHREIVKRVALALGDINSKVVYVGGAIISFYADDPASSDVRPTKDVDITLEIYNYVELTELERELGKKGFKRNPLEKVECRFFLEELAVDVMSTKGVGWAPANRWFEPGFHNVEESQIDEIMIKLLPLSYFLASKFEAFKGRGKNDARTSHDFEDIVYLLDNRINIVQEIISAPADVRDFLKIELKQVLENELQQEAISAHLDYQLQSERKKIINKKIFQIVNAF